MLQLEGRIRHILPTEIIKTQRGDSLKGGFIFTYMMDDKEADIYFEMFGKKLNDMHVPKAGTEVKVGFSVQTNEWKGKYFVKCDPIRIDIIGEEEVKGVEIPHKEDKPFKKVEEQQEPSLTVEEVRESMNEDKLPF